MAQSLPYQVGAIMYYDHLYPCLSHFIVFCSLYAQETNLHFDFANKQIEGSTQIYVYEYPSREGYDKYVLLNCRCLAVKDVRNTFSFAVFFLPFIKKGVCIFSASNRMVF